MPTIVSAGQILNLDRPPAIETGLINSIEFYNDRMLDYAAIFRTQPNVRVVIDFLSRNIAQLGIHLYERQADDDRLRVTDHPFVRRLRQPNPADRRSNRYRFTYSLVQSICTYDTAIGTFIGDHPTAGPAMILLPADAIKLGGDNWLWPDKYILRRNRGKTTLEPHEVFHLQGSLNLEDPRMGVSPIESLRHILAEDHAAGTYREQFWKSGARISGYLTRPANAPRWQPGSKTRFLNQFRSAFSGAGELAGGTPLLEDGMEFKEAALSAKDSQYLEARKLTRQEAAAAFHVHPAFVGILENANFSNMREQHRSLYMDTLGPWLSMLDLDLTLQMLPVYEIDEARLENLYVEMNFREKLRGSLEEEAAAISQLTGAPTLTRNEGRALMNRNALPGGDQLITPLNVVVGGQTIPGEAPPGADERETGTASRTPGTKALALPDALVINHVGAATAQLERFFTRQKAEILATLGANPTADVGEIYDADRWTSELTVDLAGLSQTAALGFAGLLAEAWDFDEFDETALLPLILANAGNAAENINGTTAAAIASGMLASAGNNSDEISHVFEVAISARAPQIAQTRTTWAGNFGRTEVARQSGRSQKIWRVTSSNPRPSHAAMSGVTAEIGATFPNGMTWPGDPAGGAAETANCSCTIDFT